MFNRVCARLCSAVCSIAIDKEVLNDLFVARRQSRLKIQHPHTVGIQYSSVVSLVGPRRRGAGAGVELQRDLEDLLFIPELGGLLREILRKWVTRLSWPAGDMGVVLLRDERR